MKRTTWRKYLYRTDHRLGWDLFSVLPERRRTTRGGRRPETGGNLATTARRPGSISITPGSRHVTDFKTLTFAISPFPSRRTTALFIHTRCLTNSGPRPRPQVAVMS